MSNSTMPPPPPRKKKRTTAPPSPPQIPLPRPAAGTSTYRNDAAARATLPNMLLYEKTGFEGVRPSEGFLPQPFGEGDNNRAVEEEVRGWRERNLLPPGGYDAGFPKQVGSAASAPRDGVVDLTGDGWEMNREREETMGMKLGELVGRNTTNFNPRAGAFVPGIPAGFQAPLDQPRRDSVVLDGGFEGQGRRMGPLHNSQNRTQPADDSNDDVRHQMGYDSQHGDMQKPSVSAMQKRADAHRAMENRELAHEKREAEYLRETEGVPKHDPRAAGSCVWKTCWMPNGEHADSCEGNNERQGKVCTRSGHARGDCGERIENRLDKMMGVGLDERGRENESGDYLSPKNGESEEENEREKMVARGLDPGETEEEMERERERSPAEWELEAGDYTLMLIDGEVEESRRAGPEDEDMGSAEMESNY